jgi:hypothetical protein
MLSVGEKSSGLTALGAYLPSLVDLPVTLTPVFVGQILHVARMFVRRIEQSIFESFAEGDGLYRSF